MNIFDPANPDQVSLDGQKFTGVNKMIVLALVRDIPETYENVKLIFKKANLNDIKFKLACNLKILNVILGLSSHEGKHSCMYCDGIQETLGDLRTIQSIKSCHEIFKHAGSDKKMKEFGNVINECLLIEDDNAKVLEIMPISDHPNGWGWLKLVTHQTLLGQGRDGSRPDGEKLLPNDCLNILCVMKFKVNKLLNSK